ncbi:MAG: YceH family protein [Acidobacteriota bacterium]|nr:YceH family protein [Acidobacteriota bacterium]
MSYSVTTLDGERKPRRLPARELDPLEIRILGCLMEKQLATPEYYPLTLNALVAACNQKSNREPVMEVGESDIQRALDRLQDEKLVWKVLGGRATRWDHNLDTTWHLDRPAKAVLALLFLRGAQTAGELRGRSDRLNPFETIADVEATLQRLGTGEDAILRELPRRSGQKETRWIHRLGGAYVEPAAIEEETQRSGEPLSLRVQRLEEQVAAVMSELRESKAKLGE